MRVVDSPGGTATRFRLQLSYDGSEFHGWAKQRGLRTVEGELGSVVDHLVAAHVDLTCAGRTDAGVHARGQVVHFDAERVDRLTLDHLNGALPHDIRVRQLDVVPPEFDARFSARWRRYSYSVSDDPRGPDPLVRRYQLALSNELDIDAMNEASRALVGEHDFSSYCKVKEHGTSVRELLELEWERRVSAESGLRTAIMHVKADAFCRSMVRSLAGALIPVGQGRKNREHPAQALDKRSRDVGIAVMPAHALVLEEVGYPPADQWEQRQWRTRSLRSGLQ
ncbi:MAG: tRNA pseudouridine(38-40) synthase TruA [Actinomycetia bacterium]|nr:tRNA pseudouridine(38-40) synthase TruA [Actinomycetes bacterium]MCH9788538.1 tRNA pseudouridine(38-40) synthase TruA [Actinomycetes bacterium]